MKKIIALGLAVIVVLSGISAAFAVEPLYKHENSDHTYVVFGDSFTTGFATSADSDLCQSGLFMKLPTAYPYLFAEMEYGDGFLDKYDQLGCMGSGVGTLLYLTLDDNIPLKMNPEYKISDLRDEQLALLLKWNIDQTAEFAKYSAISDEVILEKMKSCYSEAALAADVISIDIGFGDIFDLVNWFDYDGDGEEDSNCRRSIVWDYYKNDPEVQAMIKTCAAPFEILKGTDDESFRYILDVVESMVYGYFFQKDYTYQLYAELVKQNPDVVVLALSKSNIWESYIYDDGIIYLDLSEIIAPIIELLNQQLKEVCNSFDNVVYVDVSESENIATENKKLPGYNLDILNLATDIGKQHFMSQGFDSRDDMAYQSHPSDAGSVYRATQMYKAYHEHLEELEERELKASIPGRIDSAINWTFDAINWCFDTTMINIHNGIETSINNIKTMQESFIYNTNEFLWNQVEFAKYNFEQFWDINPTIITK